MPDIGLDPVNEGNEDDDEEEDDEEESSSGANLEQDKAKVKEEEIKAVKNGNGTTRKQTRVVVSKNNGVRSSSPPKVVIETPPTTASAATAKTEISVQDRSALMPSNKMPARAKSQDVPTGGTKVKLLRSVTIVDPGSEPSECLDKKSTPKLKRKNTSDLVPILKSESPSPQVKSNSRPKLSRAITLHDEEDLIDMMEDTALIPKSSSNSSISNKDKSNRTKKPPVRSATLAMSTYVTEPVNLSLQRAAKAELPSPAQSIEPEPTKEYLRPKPMRSATISVSECEVQTPFSDLPKDYYMTADEARRMLPRRANTVITMDVLEPSRKPGMGQLGRSHTSSAKASWQEAADGDHAVVDVGLSDLEEAAAGDESVEGADEVLTCQIYHVWMPEKRRKKCFLLLP